MRVFVAGASGAIGTRLVPRLIEAGHEVIGTSRSAANADRVRALGAHPIALDLLEREAVIAAVVAAEPDAIIHQATALADRVQLVEASYDGAWELPALGAVTAPPALLIRPDGYVAWVRDGTVSGLADALTTWFGPPTAA